VAGRPEPSGNGNGGDPQVTGAKIAGLAAVAVAVIGLVGTVITLTFSNHGTPTGGLPPVTQTSPYHLSVAPSLPATSPRPAPSSPHCPSKLAITSPTNGQQVSGAAGVQVSGIACGLVNEYGWVFDHDTEDHYYYEVYPNNPSPAVLQNGNWTVLDQPIGSPGDLNKTYFVTLVLASGACNTALLNMPQISGDYKVLTFPAGCQIVQEINVSVTYPR
jgi:hypothetical protein